jgi:DNA primase
MKISESKINEILSSADIVDVIHSSIPLRRRGKNYIGLCPFHPEKTPSFTVSPEKQIYHCFGCHAGGNAYKFIMEYEKVSFIEAVQILAESLGISIEYEKSENQDKKNEQEVLYDINSEVGRYYSNYLLKEDEGEVARKYLEDRNISMATTRSFGLGFSPKDNSLTHFLEQKKIDLEKGIKLGLIGEGYNGRLYDKFNGRLIYPIFSPNGRIIAFAGRVLENEDKGAKYLNSPESAIYIKGRTLYGLSHSKEEIRKENRAIIVEGYMDLLALHQHGIKNIVAISGTAFTEDQARLLSRYTKNVVLIFDSDVAVLKASLRSIEILLKQNFEIKIASLPEGEDPDSYINKFGKENFIELVNAAFNFLEFQIKYYKENNLLNDYSSSTETIREIVRLLSFIEDDLKRNLLLKEVSKTFDLRENLLESELLKVKKFEIKSSLKIPKNTEQSDGVDPKTKRKLETRTLILEKELLQIILEGDDRTNEVIFHNISEEEFKIEIHNKLFQLLLGFYYNHEIIKPHLILAKLDDPELNEYISTLSFEKYSLSDQWEAKNPAVPKNKILFKAALDTIKKIKFTIIEDQILRETKRMESQEVDEIEAMNRIKELLTEKKEINDKMREENFN